MTKKNTKSKKYIELNDNITNNIILKNNIIYVVTKQIRISSGVNLTIEDNTHIYLLNKPLQQNILIPNGFNPTDNDNNDLFLNASCLIFESGSSLSSKNIYISSCDENYIPQFINLNGGIFFCGTRSSTQYNILNVESKIGINQSNFVNESINIYYGGSLSFLVQNNVDLSYSIVASPDLITQKNITAIPLNSVTFIGCTKSEVNIKSINVFNTGSNGLWSQYSTFSLNSLIVSGYQGNALFVRGSKISIKNKLSLIQNLIPTFPLYNGILINIEELIGNKPNVIPFPPNEYNLPKNLFISTVELKPKNCLGLELDLYEPVVKLRDTVSVIENPPATNFSNGLLGTYYSGFIYKKIIFTRNTQL
jgi:hypothetical protein